MSRANHGDKACQRCGLVRKTYTGKTTVRKAAPLCRECRALIKVACPECGRRFSISGFGWHRFSQHVRSKS